MIQLACASRIRLLVVVMIYVCASRSRKAQVRPVRLKLIFVYGSIAWHRLRFTGDWTSTVSLQAYIDRVLIKLYRRVVVWIWIL